MKAEIICFSENGKETAKTVAALFDEGVCTLWLKSKYALLEEPFRPVEEPLPQWSQKHWDRELLVFVGALGIAVRAISASVKSKTSDPAIVVLDERMNFCIPLLSGHLGGANAWAGYIAEAVNATAVITTATDVNRLFAVDVFADKNHLVIDSMKLAKEVSAALIAGQTIGVYAGEGVILPKTLPRQLVKVSTREEAKAYPLGISISVRRDEAYFPRTLQLVPRILYLGMGCKKNKEAAAIRALYDRVMGDAGFDERALKGLASIDLKKDEPGLLALAGDKGIPFVTYSAEELLACEGEYSSSAFVKNTTGVDNVCERSAFLSSGSGKLILKKTAMEGVTAAAAVRIQEVHFE